jgi:hypothetical protein
MLYNITRNPPSDPVSAFGALGKGEVGYFKMINE